MAEYDEEILRQRVWYWLETTKEMEVDGEVNIGTGRIDLVGETSEGEVWGIEVKTGDYKVEQADRYAESEYLDRLYIASGNKLDPENQNYFTSLDISELSQTSKKLSAGVKEGWYTQAEVVSRLNTMISDADLNREIGSQSAREYVRPTRLGNERSKDPISLEKGARIISRVFSFPRLGVIYVPSSGDESDFMPTEAPSPEILKRADKLERDQRPAVTRREEPWVRHWLWREYGGIPEGHVPNIMESDIPYRPIDLITFVGSTDPTDALQSPAKNKVIGIEAKGESSFSPQEIINQLTEFLETEALSEVYLAVPVTRESAAADLLSATDSLRAVGLITVSETGQIDIIVEATEIQPEYDGYLEAQEKRKVGYGDGAPSGLQAVVAPYITDEEADRLRYENPAEHASDLLVDSTNKADEDGYIRSTITEPRQNPIDDLQKNITGERGYILEGEAASTRGKMITGYFHVVLRYFDCKGKDAILWHFGSADTGGYLWFVGDELDTLQDVLHSLMAVKGGEVAGYGDVLDLESVSNVGYSERRSLRPHLSYASERETKHTLKIRSMIAKSDSCVDEDIVASLILGGDNAGIRVQFTYIQWLDLIATIDILREGTGKTRELPGEDAKRYRYGRVCPSGHQIEKEQGLDWSDVIN